MRAIIKTRAITLAKTVAAGAVWLWRLPPIRSVIMTQIVRLIGGGTVTGIVVAIVDALAQ